MSEDGRRVERGLKDLESRLRALQAPLLEGLRPGLSPDAAAVALAAAGVDAAPGLVALYSWHDGAEGAGPPAELIPTAAFMSLTEAVAVRELELELAAENELLPDLPRDSIFDPRWFPILQDAAGRIYVVEGSGRGRVLIFDRLHPGDPEELSPGLAEFVNSAARDGLELEPEPLSAGAADLIALLESDSSPARWDAVRELARKRPPEAFDPLVAMLRSPDPQARLDAALLLGTLGDARASRALDPLAASDPDVRVRTAAGSAIRMLEGRSRS